MRIARTVKSRIILALILILIPAAVLLAFIFSAWYRARHDLAYGATHERSASSAFNFANYVNDLGMIGSVIGQVVAPLLPDNPEAASRLMASYRPQIGNVSHVAFISPEGVTIGGDPDSIVGIRVSDRDYFKRIVAGSDLVLSRVLVSRYSNKPTITIVRAVRNDGRLLGMVAIYVNIERLQPVFLPRERDEILILLDPAGTLVYHSQHPNLSWEERRRVGPMFFRQATAIPSAELVKLKSPLDTDDWLGDWTTVPGFRWKVGTFRLASMVTGPLQKEFARGIGWIIVTLIILVILVWYLGVRISEPATELAAVSQAVASGNLTVRARRTGQDEFGQVGNAFNQMVKKLQQTRAEAEARQQQLEFLYEAGLKLTTTLPLDDLINAVIHEIARVTRASVVEVLLYDHERRSLSIRAQIGLPESNIGVTFAIGEGIPGRVAETHHPIAIADLSTEPGFLRRDMAVSEGLQSLLVVPLVTGGDTIGVIDLFTKQRRTFREDEIELTSTLASIAATGIANSQLYEREKKIARTLEASFVPSSIEVPGMDVAAVYRPRAREAEIGGDFMDVIPLSKGHHAVVIGDVAGKGLQAAVYTNMIKYSLRAYAFDGRSPAEVLTATNTVVVANTEIGQFATLVYCQISPGAREIVWVSAGHEEMLVYRRASHSIEPHPSTSMVVGISPGTIFKAETSVLEPGDRVVLFTDGITESRHGEDFFGIVRVKKAILETSPCTARKTADTLFDRAYEFSRHHFTDDVAILVFGPGE